MPTCVVNALGSFYAPATKVRFLALATQPPSACPLRVIFDAQGRSNQCPDDLCAVERRRFPVGVNPTRQPLQPEATGAAMEVTKWLKPSDSGHDLR
jgi:hypothetical protein